MTELEIIEQYSALVRILALARTGQPSDADDVYQEVFYRYIDKQPTFRNEEHAKAWFIRVTLNITKNLHRSAHRSRRFDLEDDAIENTVSDEDFMEEVERRADFERNLAMLPPRYKAVMMLHFDCGYTAREIAKLLGETEVAVKNVLARGKAQYRSILLNNKERNHRP